MKDFSVLTTRSPKTPKRSIGNLMENLKTWIRIGKIKHGKVTIKKLWQILKEALKKNIVSIELGELNKEEIERLTYFLVL